MDNKLCETKPPTEYVCELCGDTIEVGKENRLPDGDVILCTPCYEAYKSNVEINVMNLKKEPAP